VDVPGSIRLDVDPIWLPWALMTYIQSLDLKSGLIYVTEADQVIHLADDGVYDFCTDTSYVAPWRLDLEGPNGECEFEESRRFVTADGTIYRISNGAGTLDGAPNEPFGTIPIRSTQGAFSGAFLCTVEFFRKIKFRKALNLPVEHATGFDAKSTGKCLKTTHVERFWVDHLSPRDRWMAT
jgi:hypothetical protein